jgi:hypothetical protein
MFKFSSLLMIATALSNAVSTISRTAKSVKYAMCGVMITFSKASNRCASGFSVHFPEKYCASSSSASIPNPPIFLLLRME